MNESILNINYRETLDKIDSYKEYLSSVNMILDTQLWKKSLSINTRESYSHYLAIYPKGLYSKEAQNKIKEIKDKDKEAWELAKKKHTIESYTSYLEFYPSSMYSQKAKIEIDKLEKEEQQRKRLVTDFKGNSYNKYKSDVIRLEALSQLGTIIAFEHKHFTITIILIYSIIFSIIFSIIAVFISDDLEMLSVFTTTFVSLLLFNKYIFYTEYYIGEYGITKEWPVVVEIYFKDIRSAEVMDRSIEIVYKHSNEKILIPIEAGKILNECENFPLKIKNI